MGDLCACGVTGIFPTIGALNRETTWSQSFGRFECVMCDKSGT